MLAQLSIRNYILIDSLDVEFPEGLCIVTGQTGAGKSILLGALSLLTGAKADASQISQGADSCVVEGEFVCEDERLKAIVDGNDLEWDGGRLIIRRVLSRGGRARAFVNDAPVPVSVLGEMSAYLIDIHSQNQTAILSDRGFQLEMLDRFAGNAELAGECSEAWRALQDARRQVLEARQKLERLNSERDYVAAQFKSLDDARLREGELEELETEQGALANADEIKEALCQLESLFNPEEGMGVDATLKEAGRLLDRVSPFVPSLAGLSERLHSARIELSDIAATASEVNAGVSPSRERLEQVEDRMSLIYSLLQKFSKHDEGELIALRDEYSAALYDTDSLEGRIAELEKKVAALEKDYNGLCGRLHASRLDAAPALASKILESLRFLELDSAAFEVDVRDAAPSGTGCDAVHFLFDALGKNPVDVAKCASGGERSRIMLCLKAVMAEFSGMPTMIFDEIDTGVSGSAADSMGTMICGMGDSMQVIAITHLPQVAAKGKAHFVVRKEDGVSSLVRIEGDERVHEIARLLSGAAITPESIANAKSLLGLV